MTASRKTSATPATRSGLLAAAALAVSLLLAALTAIGAGPEAVPFTFTSDSEMHIDGTSNVHDWTCDVSSVNGTMAVDTAATEAKPVVEAADVRVPLDAVDCGRDGMTENLREAMQATAYPEVRYRVDSAAVRPHPDSTGWLQVTATGPLTVAGSTRTAEVTAAGRRLADGRFRVAGAKTIDMTDFGVEPPTAMLGALQTGEDVTIRFDVTAAPKSAGASR